jgi:hypothetical protein
MVCEDCRVTITLKMKKPPISEGLQESNTFTKTSSHGSNLMTSLYDHIKGEAR